MHTDGNVKEIMEKTIDDFSNALQAGVDKTFEQYGLSLIYSLSDDIRLKYESALGFEIQTCIDYYNLGVKAAEEGSFKEATKEFKNALKLNPKHMGSHYNLGLVYEESGDKSKALESFKEYITLYDAAIVAFSGEGYGLSAVSPQEKEFYKEAKSKLKG